MITQQRPCIELSIEPKPENHCPSRPTRRADTTLAEMKSKIGDQFEYREKGPGFTVKLIDVRLVGPDYVIDLEVVTENPGADAQPRRFTISANRHALTITKARWSCPYVSWALMVLPSVDALLTELRAKIGTTMIYRKNDKDIRVRLIDVGFEDQAYQFDLNTIEVIPEGVLPDTPILPTRLITLSSNRFNLSVSRSVWSCDVYGDWWTLYHGEDA